MPQWKIAEGQLEEHPIRIHFRGDLGPDGQFPICARITWQAAQIDKEGLPDQDEMQRIDHFNQCLLKAVEEPGVGVLTMVLIADGECQWVLYTKETEAFKTAVDGIPTEGGLYPIETVVDEDPNWDVQQQILESIQNAPAP